jgi:hypothetical protein
MCGRFALVVDEFGRVEGHDAIVDPGLEVWVRGETVWGDVGGGDAELV